ncbi:MAG: hypothetical protein H0W88_00125 [Parachlamydiaceae bacterium]|nr:hypothetical protein [Parachlamydiaceae bacterium]
MQSSTLQFELNENQTIAYFYPPEEKWEKKLNGFEHFYSTMFPVAAFYFQGEIQIDRFIDAMAKTLEDFPMMFARLRTTSDGSYAEFSGFKNDKEKYKIQLEISEQNVNVEEGILENILPNYVDQKIKQGIVDDTNNLPMGAFRITKFENGFSLGYYINHAFFDQSSILYFFKYLSDIYTNGTTTHPKPFLIDVATLKPKIPPSFKNLTEIRDYSKTVGMRYVNDINELYQLLTTPYPGTIFNLVFNRDQLEKFRNENDLKVSANDIIQAVLFKIYSYDKNLTDEDNIYFAFPCNLKKRCGFNENGIGNVITGCQSFFRVGDLRNASLTELAKKSRERVDQINTETFKENLVWFESLLSMGESPQKYLPTAFFEPLYFGASNWASFNYETVNFDDNTPFALKTTSIPTLGISIICFSGGKELEYTLSIAVPHNSTDSLYLLEKTSHLFSINLEK